MEENYTPTGLESQGVSWTRCDTSWTRKSAQLDDAHKLYWCTGGEGFYWLGGQEQRLEKGQVYLIPASARSRFHCPDRFELYWFHFRFTHPARDLWLSRLQTIASLHQSDLAGFEKSLRCAAQAAGAPAQRELLALESLVLFFLSRVDTSEFNPLDNQARGLLPVLGYMEEHFTKNPSLEDLAKVAGQHPVYFHQQFKKQFDTTPRKWLETRRIREARNLLLGTSHSVKLIAADCGYEDEYHFSRAFKRVTGLSPSGFRSAGQLIQP